MSQLLDSNVTDLILRAQMYRDIKSDVATGDIDVIEREISLDEIYRSDLIAFRVYSRSDLAWLVDLMANREDIAIPHVSGSLLKLPTAVYVRNKIKYYSTLEVTING